MDKRVLHPIFTSKIEKTTSSNFILDNFNPIYWLGRLKKTNETENLFNVFWKHMWHLFASTLLDQVLTLLSIRFFFSIFDGIWSYLHDFEVISKKTQGHLGWNLKNYSNKGTSTNYVNKTKLHFNYFAKL